MSHYADVVRSLCDAIPSFDRAAAEAAGRRQASLTKPPGSLGRLEELSIELAGMTGEPRPHVERSAIFTFAGDHGVVAEGVSAFPQSVSVQMVANLLAGGAGVNVLARLVGARVVIADLGLAGEVPGDTTELRHLRVADGTANMAVGPAMTEGQMWQAVAAGAALVEEEAVRGLDLAGTGERGIGNTTAATAILAACGGDDPATITGPGTGLDCAGMEHKAQVIRRALEVNRPSSDCAWDVLQKVGGFEIAGLVGVILGCSARRIPCVIDGFISTSAALVATRACPASRQFLFGGHRSAEPGHERMLELIGLRPILDLNMRLGEGTGAALAFTILKAAARTLDEMATFADAGVDDKL